MMASAAVVLFSLALAAQAQPNGSKDGAKATGGQERGTTGPSTSGWDPAGARASEQTSRTGTPPGTTAPNPTAAGVKHRNPRGSWEDNPKLDTQMAQQSPTYEDVTGARKPLPGIVVPALPSDEPAPAHQRQGQGQQR